MSKQIGRIALAVLVTLALSLGLTAAAGSATAATTSASACASERAQVVKAKKHVKKDKKKLKAAKKHHQQKAAKKAKKKLKKDRKKLARAKAAYSACLNRPAPSGGSTGSTGGTPDAAADPISAQCLEVAGQLASQDPTGQLAVGAAAFCDLLGELAASAGGDPTAVCDQLAANDPTGQLGQICDALGGGIPDAPAIPGLPALPGTDGGLIGSTLEDLCDQIAAQDPTGQLQPLCSGLGSLPI